MGFEGPDVGDYENVVVLNQAWLALLQSDSSVVRGLGKLPEDLRQRMTNLSERQIARLAKTPFLLFSFRENEDAHWTRALDADRDLFAVNLSVEADTLMSAGLGFTWQLARKNPYALRLVCGATLSWSERIAELTFLELLHAARSMGDLPVIRYGQQRDLWRKLLDGGVSGQELCCHATQLTALQSVLTQSSSDNQQTWPLAARSVRAPGRQVAEANETTQE